MPRYASATHPLPPEVAKAVRVIGANPIRASIVRLLAQSAEPRTTGDIERELGGVTYQTVFRHIRELEAEGIVTSNARENRGGQRVLYTVDRDALRRELDEYSRYLLGETLSGDSES